MQNIKKEKLIDIFTKFDSEPVTFQSYYYIREYLGLINHDQSMSELVSYFKSKNILNVNVFDVLSTYKIYRVENEKLVDYSWLYYQYLDTYASGIESGKEKVKELKATDSVNERKEMLEPVISELKDFARDINKARKKHPHFFCDKGFKKVFETLHVYTINHIVSLEEKVRGGYKHLFYDENEGIFYFENRSVEIRLQDKNTNEDSIMKHIFIENNDRIDDDFFYREIAEDFGDDIDEEKKKSWSKYRTAFKSLNNKIVKDFFLFNASQKGRAKINPKYL